MDDPSCCESLLFSGFKLRHRQRPHPPPGICREGSWQDVRLRAALTTSPTGPTGRHGAGRMACGFDGQRRRVSSVARLSLRVPSSLAKTIPKERLCSQNGLWRCPQIHRPCAPPTQGAPGPVGLAVNATPQSSPDIPTSNTRCARALARQGCIRFVPGPYRHRFASRLLPRSLV